MKELAIGIDLGGTNLKGCVMNRAGEILHLIRIPTEADKGGQRVLENILRLIGQLIQKQGAADSILGAGIGSPGFVDTDGTVLGGAENLPGWKGTRIYEPIREKHGLAATAGNDVTVTALAEFKFGAAKGMTNAVCLALGTGIGGGIVTNGHIYKGTHGMAGELGHICVETGGLQCTCGMKGCVEQYASATGIVKNAKLICDAVAENERTPFVDAVTTRPQSVTSKLVYDFVKKNDPIALRVHEYVCERLGRAVGAIFNTLAPDRLILGGGVMMAGQVIIDAVSRHSAKYCWPDIWKRCDIVAAQCGENAGVLGCGAMVFDEMG